MGSSSTSSAGIAMADVPDEVRRLAADRDRARRARDFATADRLRERIAELGYTVIDAPEGSRLEPTGPPGAARRLRPEEVASVLDEPATYEVSVHWVVEGWPEDVVRAIRAFRAHAGDRRIQFIVADVTGAHPDAFGDDVEMVRLVDGTGWGAARNAGLRRSLGSVVLVADASIELRGDALAPLEAALADPSVGVCGPFGIVTSDLREFEPSDGPDVDAIEGYLMAFRRDVLAECGLFDERFRWYRSADIELSFRVKERGLRAVVVPVPVDRHEHRMWANTPPAERARLSKRNYNRFLERFRGRFDLTVAGGPGSG
jgi:Glycosyltransferase like family 2